MFEIDFKIDFKLNFKIDFEIHVKIDFKINCTGLLEISLFLIFPWGIVRLVEGINLHGTPIWGSEQFIASQVANVVDNVEELHSLLPNLDDPQVALHILQSCLNVCKLNHLL